MLPAGQTSTKFIDCLTDSKATVIQLLLRMTASCCQTQVCVHHTALVTCDAWKQAYEHAAAQWQDMQNWA